MIHTRIFTGKLITELDPARRPYIDVDLPMGYRRVWSGAVKPGDLIISIDGLHEGLVQWFPVEDLGDIAESYACLIRPDQHPVEEHCVRCLAQVRDDGHRYCEECCRIVAKTKGGVR